MKKKSSIAAAIVALALGGYIATRNTVVVTQKVGYLIWDAVDANNQIVQMPIPYIVFRLHETTNLAISEAFWPVVYVTNRPPAVYVMDAEAKFFYMDSVNLETGEIRGDVWKP